MAVVAASAPRGIAGRAALTRLASAPYHAAQLAGEGERSSVPLAVLCNKSDLSGCVGSEELRQALGIATRDGTDGGGEDGDDGGDGETKGAIRLFRGSVLDGAGHEEALRWLAGHLRD